MQWLFEPEIYWAAGAISLLLLLLALLNLPWLEELSKRARLLLLLACGVLSLVLHWSMLFLPALVP